MVRWRARRLREATRTADRVRVTRIRVRSFRKPTLVLLAVASLGAALAACGGDDGDDESSAPAGESGGTLFTQTADSGMLRPVAGEDGVFTLTLTNPGPKVTTFKDRPAREAGSEGVADFVDHWDARGFGQDPPNAALVVDTAPDEADTTVFTLADPRYDEGTGTLTYRATRVEGGGTDALPDDEADAPPQFEGARVFIDSADAAEVHGLFVETLSQGSVKLSFDPAFTVIFGSGQGINFHGGDNRGRVQAEPTFVSMSASSYVSLKVSGSLPITGTASVMGQPTIKAELDGGTTDYTITGGKFCIGPGCSGDGATDGAGGTETGG